MLVATANHERRRFVSLASGIQMAMSSIIAVSAKATTDKLRCG